jgi:hypothetical protein
MQPLLEPISSKMDGPYAYGNYRLNMKDYTINKKKHKRRGRQGKLIEW